MSGAPVLACAAAPARLRVVDRVAAFSAVLEAARAAGRTVGLVPTMGALHAGHRSLVERAAAECDTVAVTIFVNPLQFGEAVDLETYPRTLDADLALCEAAGAAVVLAPGVAEMYPGWPAPLASRVSVDGISASWEGASRPGHFDGVCTVVAKLFAMAGRCRAYFGEKDFQQLAVVRRMAADLSFPVEVVGCPTVREADGLAMSSRNVRLSPAERRAALVLSRALAVGARAVQAGERRPAEIEAAMAAEVATEPLATLDYAAVVRAEDLVVPGPEVVPTPGVVPGSGVVLVAEPDVAVAGVVPGPDVAVAGPDVAVASGVAAGPGAESAAGCQGALRLLIAARVGPVRLIDNCDPLSVPADSGRLVSGGTC